MRTIDQIRDTYRKAKVQYVESATGPAKDYAIVQMLDCIFALSGGEHVSREQLC